MKQLETDLKTLRQSLLEMMMLVASQVEKATEAFITGNTELALQVISTERRVNAYELKIDADCENIFALQNPVAIDLRFVMAAYNMASTLERIADIADGIARYAAEMEEAIDPYAIKVLRLDEMDKTTISMMNDIMDAFEDESPQLAYGIHSRDLILNEINIQSADVITELVKSNPELTKKYLFQFSAIKKIERIGDLLKNIAEELIFYIEAKIIKHNHQKAK